MPSSSESSPHLLDGGRGGRATVTPIHDAARHLDVRPILTPDRCAIRPPSPTSGRSHRMPSWLADYGQIVPAPLLELRTER